MTQLKAEKLAANQSNPLRVRTPVKSGGENRNRNQTLIIRSTLRAGGIGDPGHNLNHNETLQVR
jgi:hypothetical protein